MQRQGAGTVGDLDRHVEVLEERSKRANAPWISTWTLRSWPSGKKSGSAGW
jgi:hypothetical protein